MPYHQGLALALLAGIAAIPASAQERGAPAGSQKTREFVQAAGQSDMFEILEGQAALAESKDPQIRAFAQQMIQDHLASSRNLEAATQRAGLTPPPKSLGSDQSMLLMALQSQRGPDFDKVYVRHQALAHRSALTTVQQYAAGGDLPAVRQAASGTAPMIASHLAMAEQMQASYDAK